MNPAHHGKTLLGIGFLVAATACFAVLDTTVKVVGAFVSILVAVWFRYLFQAVAMTALVLPFRGRRMLRTQHPRYQLLRGALLFTVSSLSFLSVQYMPVGEFTAIIMTTPLVVMMLAAVWLKERVTPLRWLLVAGGFAGALLVVRPGSDVFGWASLLPLLMVICYAWFQILTSRMTRTEDPMTMHFYTGWVGAALATVLVPLAWKGMPDGHTLALLCLAGLMGTVGHFLLIQAFARAPASTLSPFLYVQIGFALLCGWWVFDHVPGWLEAAGVLLIVVCGVAARLLTRPAALPTSPKA
jgi:drug/metabolite transporter (DMT)-like permease